LGVYIEQDELKNYYFCYSRRLSYFVRAFSIPYVRIGTNWRTGCKYYVFPKSEKLDAVIQLWNSVKDSLESYDASVISYGRIVDVPPSEKGGC